MAKLTIRYPQIPPFATNRDLFANGEALATGWARKARLHTQTVIWNNNRFKRGTGKSTRAWTEVIDREGLGIALVNTATNRYGARYAKWVHLAGTPKSNKLLDEVKDYVAEVIGPGYLEALGRDFKATQRRRMSSTTLKFKG